MPPFCSKGCHHVPEEDVRRRLERSRRQWRENFLPLADDWGVWDNQAPPALQMASRKTRTLDQLHAMLNSPKLQEAPPQEMSEMSRIVLEASRVATEKMLDYDRRMDIEVTPEMTLVEKPGQPAK